MLTLAEACERLRVSDRTLRKFIQSGALRAIKVGPGRNSGYRISEEDLADYIERQAVKPAS